LDRYFDGLDLKALYGDTFGGLMLGLGMGGTVTPVTPAPTLTSASLASVPWRATAITLTGTGIVTGATVDMSVDSGSTWTACTSVAFGSSTSITATTPVQTANAANTAVRFRVTNPDTQTGILGSGNVEVNMQLTIFPSLGDTAGGQHISLICDGGMTGQTTCSIGGVAAVDFVALNDTMASAVTGTGGTSGAKDVVLGSSAATITGGYTNWDPVSYFGSSHIGFWNANVNSSLTFGTGVGIAALANLGGLGGAMLQATGANQPQYQSNDQTIGGAGHMLWPSSASNATCMKAAITLAQPYTIVWFGVGGTAANDATWGATGGAGIPYQQYGGSNVVDNDTLGATNTKLTQVGDTKPLLTVSVRNGAASALYIQNSKSKKVATVSNDSMTSLTMGNIDNQGLGLDAGRVCFMMAIDRAVTDAEVEMIAKWIQSFAAPAHPAPDAQLVISGNSFTAGALATDQAVQGYAQTMAAAMPPHVQAIVDGNSGATTPGLFSCDTILQKGESSFAAKRVCVLQEIGNDIQTAGASGATAYADVLTWVANAIGFGYLPMVYTEITRAASSGWTGGMETARTTCNASLLSGATPVVGHANLYLASGGTFYVFDRDGALTSGQKDPTDATYRIDGVHPSTKLHSILAANELPAAKYVLGTLGIAA
jgi:hypothetical protein